MYKVRSEIFKNILERLLECHGDPANKITYYNRFQGYGLRATDFDGKEGCSRRVFSHWKNFLLERKSIRKPKLKRNLKDKTKDSDRNYPFVITPLGICRFTSVTDEIAEYDGKKIVEIMKDYGDYVPDIDWDEISKIISKKTLKRILKQICDSVKMEEVDDEFHINLTYKSRSGISYEKSKFVINSNEMYVQLPESTYMVELSDEPTPTSKGKIDDEILYRSVADFVIDSFCYAIVENYHWKIINKSKLLNRSDLSSKKKSNIKKSVDRYKKILEKIPFEIHLTASGFIGDNLYGEIVQEQKFVKEIYEHTYNQIYPKTGRKFRETVKPPNLFSDEIKQ